MIDGILKFNKQFVEKKDYEPFLTSKYPNKKLAILSCMDTRLTALLPAALGLKNGDAKIIKNAGAVIAHPFGSVVRSLLIAIFELGVTQIMVVGHTDCGVQHVDPDTMIAHMVSRGISKETIDMVQYCGVDFHQWLSGFDCVENSVFSTIDFLASHPLIPKNVSLYGYIMDSETGALTEVHKVVRPEN
ncbi:MAG: carbonic anhydrase [Evtepia sp.]